MVRSKREALLDAVLKELYPHDNIKQDYAIKLGPRTLYVDRVILSAKIALEVDGRQHDEFVARFHVDATGFAGSRQRDKLKEQWLRANGFSIVRFKERDVIDVANVRRKILEALNEQIP